MSPTHLLVGNPTAQSGKNAERIARARALLADAAVALEKAGAQCVVLCTNTMHKVAAAIEAAVQIPLLHIADLPSAIQNHLQTRKSQYLMAAAAVLVMTGASFIGVIVTVVVCVAQRSGDPPSQTRTETTQLAGGVGPAGVNE